MKFETTLILLLITAVTIIIIRRMKPGKLKKITKEMQLRGCDPLGCGHYGASRSHGTHKGVDLVVVPGEQIYAPFSGKVTRYPYPYSSDLSYRGIEIVGDEYKMKIFYMIPGVNIGETVKPGQAIGTAQNISSKYSPGMTNHVHVELYDKSGSRLDPTNILNLG